MNLYLNKSEIENGHIYLSFNKIKSFDELINCDLENVIYIEDTKKEFPKAGIITNHISKKRRFFSKVIYFKLNDCLFEPTIIYRDDFASCKYIFYKVSFKIINNKRK
jgi:hypothetical protein